METLSDTHFHPLKSTSKCVGNKLRYALTPAPQPVGSCTRTRLDVIWSPPPFHILPQIGVTLQLNRHNSVSSSCHTSVDDKYHETRKPIHTNYMSPPPPPLFSSIMRRRRECYSLKDDISAWLLWIPSLSHSVVLIFRQWRLLPRLPRSTAHPPGRDRKHVSC